MAMTSGCGKHLEELDVVDKAGLGVLQHHLPVLDAWRAHRGGHQAHLGRAVLVGHDEKVVAVVLRGVAEAVLPGLEHDELVVAGLEVDEHPLGGLG